MAFVTYLFRLKYLEMDLPELLQVNPMTETPQSLLSEPQSLSAALPLRRSTSVWLSLRIAADRRRIIHALSISEYIEAWLQMPESDELLFVFEPLKQESFRIQLYRAEGLHTSIYGSSSIVDGNQVTYQWKATSRGRTTESVVSVQIAETSRGCTLRLRHSGFQDWMESAWHSRLWQGSLERLSRLILADLP
ncbi:MAG TPA: SRPBCC domain-containing protein [Acidobacteriaceae bacterium]